MDQLCQSIPALEQFPIVRIPSIDSDNVYPVLDWQRHVARRLINQFLTTPTWLHNQLEHARFAHIPIGNLPADVATYVADVFYSRHLLRHNHVLWASPSDRPDLGGHEEDDYRMLTSTEEGGSLELNNPGLYSTVCVELMVDMLAVNAVLQASHVNDYEGASATSISFDYAPQASLEELMEGSGGQSSLSVYDESALCSSAFKILKSLVHTWLHEMATTGNHYADLQLQHFYRWIRSPTSLLYEPAICRIIHKLMKKLYMQLVGEFKRLGSAIVYADFSRIILCTKKRRVKDACAYVDFIVNSIKSRDLFHSIHFEARSCWNMLLWMDKSNYGGMSFPMSSVQKFFSDEEEHEETEDDEVMEVEEEGIEMKWSLAKYLPEAASCQEIFLVIIAGHIKELYTHLMEQQQSHLSGGTPVRRRTGSSQTQTPSDNTVIASSVSFAQRRIETELSEKLFTITQKIHRTLGSGGAQNRSSQLFPQLPGSHLPLTNPALEFVKYICKVLSLDPTTRHQVTKLRRDLLKLIGVREFSEDAIFQDPCRSYILPEVICESCNSCRDIDLCRDLYTTMDEQSGRPVWCCLNCASQYNSEVIEQTLIEVVQRMSVGVVVQDLICIKCRGVKQSNMAEYCTCAGSFAETQPADQLREQFTTFNNIAQHFQMSLLEETVSWLLDKH